ncbi:small ribosomal subunit protein bS6m-like [Amphiura filiformis]|uniref:small ribosomal subunit protein bS6m-like n=1 Tax=Amphiura filiformis TaxID=82378 RepID=UPI003B227171
MPGYEMSLILRAMEKPQLVGAVKRALTFVIENGGIVRKLESMGEKNLPYRMRAHQENFTKGHYFVVDFEAAPSLLGLLGNFQHRDIDVIKQGVKRREDPPAPPCPGPYSDLYTGASKVNKTMLRPKKKKGAVKWPNVDKMD